jgi:hypothetical protein
MGDDRSEEAVRGRRREKGQWNRSFPRVEKTLSDSVKPFLPTILKVEREERGERREERDSGCVQWG